jgi:hypothetical protein
MATDAELLAQLRAPEFWDVEEWQFQAPTSMTPAEMEAAPAGRVYVHDGETVKDVTVPQVIIVPACARAFHISFDGPCHNSPFYAPAIGTIALDELCDLETRFRYTPAVCGALHCGCYPQCFARNGGSKSLLLTMGEYTMCEECSRKDWPQNVVRPHHYIPANSRVYTEIDTAVFRRSAQPFAAKPFDWQAIDAAVGSYLDWIVFAQESFCFGGDYSASYLVNSNPASAHYGKVAAMCWSSGDNETSFDVYWNSFAAFEAEVAAWLATPRVAVHATMTEAERWNARAARTPRDYDEEEAEEATVFMEWIRRVRAQRADRARLAPILPIPAMLYV